MRKARRRHVSSSYRRQQKTAVKDRRAAEFSILRLSELVWKKKMLSGRTMSSIVILWDAAHSWTMLIVLTARR